MNYLRLCFNSLSSWISRKSLFLVLAFCSCFFGLTGVSYGFKVSGPFVSLILLSATAQVSISGLVFSRLFPLLLIFLAMIYDKPGFLVVICTLKSFLFGLVFSSVNRLYGSAGWIISALLLFSDSVTTILVHYFSFRHADRFHSGGYKEIRWIIFLVLLAVFVDVLFISPFLRSVFNS